MLALVKRQSFRVYLDEVETLDDVDIDDDVDTELELNIKQMYALITDPNSSLVHNYYLNICEDRCIKIILN